MSDRLLYVALVLSAFGLLLLVFVSNFLEVPYTRIGGVDSTMLEKNVHLRGEVSSVHAFKGGSLLLSVSEDNSTIQVYVPYSVATVLNMTTLQDSDVDLVGLVQLYDGKLEVVINKPADLVVE